MNKKGFTLIELLAVIIVLAIIALIATPVVMNIIEKSKMGALKDSVYGMMKASELYYMNQIDNNREDKIFICSNNKCLNETERLHYRGSIKNGTVVLLKDSKTAICLDDGKYYALKKLNELNVTVGEGVCGAYNNGNFHIISDVELVSNEVNITEQSGIKIISNDEIKFENSGRKTLNQSYTVNSIINYIQLPNNNSTATYKFKVKNDLADSIKINEIVKGTYNNNNIKYELINFDINNDVIEANSEKEIIIKFSWENYNGNNTKLSSQLVFEFAKEQYTVALASNISNNIVSDIVSYKENHTFNNIIPTGYVLDKVECTNNQKATEINNAISINNITDDTTCTVYSVSPEILNINYTGKEQIYIVPKTGNYKLETWGAQGGSISGYTGGLGGYSKGEVTLTKYDILYINVGGAGIGATGTGQTLNGGYNGGGKVIGRGNVNHINASGGGATHIAKKSGLLETLANNINSILIVSGGGGGARNQSNHVSAARWGHGGAGGGLKGTGASSSNGSTSSLTVISACAGGQTSGNKFGKGGDATGNSGGGAGLYGGYSGYSSCGYSGSGSGGSGYIGSLENSSMQNGVRQGNGAAKISIINN